MSTQTATTLVRDTTVVRHFRTGTVEGFLPRLNADLHLQLTSEAFQILQNYCKNTALRDPTVGELRILDALGRATSHTPDRIAVGEMITHSHAVAETWADMMAKHGALHGASQAFRGDHAATPPCTLADLLSLTRRYLRRSRPLGEEAEENLPLLPADAAAEAVASAEGYTPIARLAMGEGERSLWVRKHPPLAEKPASTGDLILYLPQIKPAAIRSLLERESANPRPALGAIRAVANAPLLAVLHTLCPAVELHAARLGAETEGGGCLPLARLCGRPVVEADGSCGYLLRVARKQITAMNQLLTELGLTSVVCGQAKTGGNTVISVRDPAGERDIPAVTLPASVLLCATAPVLYTMHPEADQSTPPRAVNLPILRLPALQRGEGGLTPDGHEVAALTLPDGVLLRIPEADTLMTSLQVAVHHLPAAYSAAADTAAEAARLLESCGISPASIRLSVRMTLSNPAHLTDGTALAALCGLYCAAAKLGLPLESSTIERAPATAAPLSLEVTALAYDPEVCRQSSHVEDRQWRTLPRSEGEASVSYLLPVLRRSYEGSLHTLATALNRNHKATCTIRPLAMNPIRDEESGEVIRYVLHPESEAKLLEALAADALPVFSMNREDTRLLLAHPAVLEALRRRVERGDCILVLGDSCAAFAEVGLLPACAADLRPLAVADHRATVTYAFPAEPSTRLLRGDLLIPADIAEPTDSLMTLHLSDGITAPDGLVGCGGKVLGLLNGPDTTVLPRLERQDFRI